MVHFSTVVFSLIFLLISSLSDVLMKPQEEKGWPGLGIEIGIDRTIDDYQRRRTHRG